jgi:hypothetical protein
MGYAISQIGVALKDAVLMAWQVWWALVLGLRFPPSSRRGCPVSASSQPYLVVACAPSRSQRALARPRRRVPTRR